MPHAAVILQVLLISVFVLTAPWARADADPSEDLGLFASSIGDDLLDGQRGKALTIHNTNDLDAALYDNSAMDVVTGGNQVADGSLANNAGLATVIQNSGNNVLIQNAVILNIQMQ
jgi:hypothetical protein